MQSTFADCATPNIEKFVAKVSNKKTDTWQLNKYLPSSYLKISGWLLSSECILSDRCFLVVAEWLFTLEEADKALRMQEGRMPDLIKISIWDNIRIK